MVAINLGDSLKKEKGIAEPQLPPDKTISDAPELQFEEKCSKNGRVIFRWTILTQVVTLGLFIHLIYRTSTRLQHHQQAIRNAVFLLALTFTTELTTYGFFIVWINSVHVGYIGCHRTYLTLLLTSVFAILFTVTNVPALCAYFRTKKTRHATLKYKCFKATALWSASCVLALFTYLAIYFHSIYPTVLSVLMSFQFYCEFTWWRIQERMRQGKDHRMISIFDPIFNCGTIVREVCPDEPGSEVKEEVEGGIQPNVIA
ncbi:unnamed protein product, partial [Mesorhabditis belari]|uniref:Uncharacterized protein n=1 Tax=Mesorhabditis belari TaxID=2138241 RepID=A0AAF3EK40_9BILA